MNCTACRDRLGDWASDVLDAASRDEVVLHAQACRECRREFDRMLALVRVLEGIPEAAPVPAGRRIRPGFWIGLAAGVLAAWLLRPAVPVPAGVLECAGHRIVAEPGASVRAVGEGRVRLESGRLFATGSGGGLEIETEAAIVRVLGTEFWVEAKEAEVKGAAQTVVGIVLGVSVTSGAVLVKNRLGEARVEAGRQAVVLPGSAPRAADLALENAALKAELSKLRAEPSKPAAPAAGPLEEAVRRLGSVDGPEDKESLVEAMAILIRGGAASVPSIRSLLASGKDAVMTRSAVPSVRYGEYPTLRTALLHALRRIGGPEAAQAALDSLPEVRSALEVYEIGQTVEDWKAHRPGFVAAMGRVLHAQVEAAAAARTVQEKWWGEHYRSLLQAAGGDPQRIPAEAMKNLQEQYSRAAAAAQGVDTYGSEIDLIRSLGAEQELSQEIAEAARCGAGRTEDFWQLLGSRLEPGQALDLMRREYAERRQSAGPETRYYDLVSGIASIGTPEAHGFLRQVFAELPEEGQSRIAEGVGARLGIIGRGTGHYPVLDKGFDYERRQAVADLPVTASMARQALDLLESLQTLTTSEGVRDGLRRRATDIRTRLERGEWK